MREMFEQTHSFLAVVIVLAVIGAIIMLTFFEIPEANKEILAGLLGSLSTVALAMVVKFYFDGSKSQQIRDAGPAPTPPIPSPPPSHPELEAAAGAPVDGERSAG